MAYAALQSLLHTLRVLKSDSRIPLTSSTWDSLDSALSHAVSLEDTLERCSEGVTDMDEQIIIEESRKLEDAIEFPLSIPCESGEAYFPPTFDHLRQDVDCFVKTTKNRKHNFIEKLFAMMAPSSKEAAAKEEDPSAAEECAMVGLSDQFLMIRDKLTVGERKNRTFYTDVFVWISGMAGIGKTRLAKRIYNDPLVKKSFQCQAFVRVGQKFRPQAILRAITAQLNLDSKKMILIGDKDFYECLCRILSIRKTLIVLDDVWDEAIFLIPQLQFIEEYLGSKLLVTSRTDGYNYYHCNLKMRFLNEEESWELLRRKVFGEEEEDCPKQLVKAGKKIAKKCGGLPLLIFAVAPILLSKAQKNPESWKRVAEKPNTILEEASHQISEVLLSSYNHLHNQEKLCFLYIVAFPQDCIVLRSMITNLWCSEGLVPAISWSYSFGAICKRNLVVGHQKCWANEDIETKACSLHIAYWYVSKRVAKNNKFLYTINSYEDGLDESIKHHRRLAIHENVLMAIKEVHAKIASIPTVRSLLCTGPYHQYQVPICLELRLLRVLSALTIRFYEFPVEVVKLVRLRYLALTCNANLPPSISKLWSLEFMIIHQHLSIKRVAVDQSYVPVEIWDLYNLKYLEIIGRNLPEPPHPSIVLPNLIKLVGVGVHSCTKEVLKSMPELKKLRIQIELGPHVAQTLSCFNHVHCLKKLISFHSMIMNPILVLHPPPPPLPISSSSLKKMTLSGFGYPWESMSIIAQLPELEVLKLQCYAFRGKKWEANHMRFRSLRYLSIEDTDIVQWTTSPKNDIFPRLRRLRMKNCYKLHEIPRLSFLKRIELVDCNPLAETCAKEKHPQMDRKRDRYNYEDTERVTASYSWKS